MVKIGVAGAYGAFGLKHLDALAAIPDAKVTAILDLTKIKSKLWRLNAGLPGRAHRMKHS